MSKSGKHNESASSTSSKHVDAHRDAKPQKELFADAVKVFSAGQFDSARKLFEDAAMGRDLSVAESARMYLRMCEQRLKQRKVELNNSEDHYNYAIHLINLRNLREAQEHLRSALKGGENGHTHYAMALALGLSGEMEPAVQHLRRAIELDPSHRSLARNDTDFQPLLDHAGIREVVYSG